MDLTKLCKTLRELLEWKFFPQSVQKSSGIRCKFFYDIYAYYCASASPRFPFRPSDAGPCGVGLFAKRQTTTEHIWGVLYYIDEDTVEKLKEAKFSSLYTDSEAKDFAVLIGPLELVNHNCNACSTWTEPSSIRRPPGLKDWVDEYKTVWFQFNYNVQKDEQVLIQYCKPNKLWFPCFCCDSLQKKRCKIQVQE